MKITVIGVEVLEVDEQTFVMDEMRPRVPGRDVQLDQAIAGHPEGGDILDARPRIIIKVARWRDAERARQPKQPTRRDSSERITDRGT